MDDFFRSFFSIFLFYYFVRRLMTKNLSLFDTTIESVVDCLHERYKCFLGPKIYTNFGSILVAVNPIYLTSDEYSSIYGQSALSTADAHIYAVAKRAYEMVRPNSQETVVVIGDSGSGKTVTVGHVLDYLTANSRSPKCEAFYEKILSASHLMELFANAETCLNTNSSRFGKLISLVYSCEVVPQLEGAEVEAFLLEKSRVTSTPDPKGCGENFHILRLLVSKLDDPVLFERIFAVKKQKLVSGEFSFRVAPYKPVLSDKCFSFDRARHLLATFGCDEDLQIEIFKTLSIILHLCNLEFIARDEALGCEIAYHLPNVHNSLSALQTLLGIADCREIQQALTTKPVSAAQSRRQSVYRKACGVAEVEGRRNSVARLLYSQLFEFVMDKVCASVAPSSTEANAPKISVLDIFGFENFTNSHNDFEQLCINFCNEKIQQHFARICISDVRRELASEGLSSMTAVVDPSYTDNDSVVALLESSPSGIFCVLDEKCKLNRNGMSPSVKSPAFVKMKTVATSSPSSQSTEDFFQSLCCNFRAGNNKSIKISMSGHCEFTIFHYAGPVVYSAENFVEKSRDDVSPDLVTFFSLTVKNRFVNSLLSLKARSERGGGISGGVKPSGLATPLSSASEAIIVRKRSLPAKYRSSTAALVNFLNNSTNVHYVRCIRPNGNAASPDRSTSDRSFDRNHVANQLASAGLVDVLKLANATGKLSRRFSYRAFYIGFASLFHVFRVDCSSCSVVDDNDENKENDDENRVFEGKRPLKAVILPDPVLQACVKSLFKSLKISTEGEEVFFGNTKLFLSDKLLSFFRRLQQLLIRRVVYRLQVNFRRNQLKKQAIAEEAEKKKAELERIALLEKAEKDEQKRKEDDRKVVAAAASRIDSVDSVVSSPLSISKVFLLPSLSSISVFVDGDIISRRRHFTTRPGSLFSTAWFHVRPNPLLQGAHVVNVDLFFQHPSLTDCL